MYKKGPLVNYKNLSNFNTNHPSYNIANKGKLGLLKSETGSIPIKEAICLHIVHCTCTGIVRGDVACCRLSERLHRFLRYIVALGGQSF